MSDEGDGFAVDLYIGVAFDDHAFVAVLLAAQASIADACYAFVGHFRRLACGDDPTASVGMVSQPNDAPHRSILISDGRDSHRDSFSTMLP